MTAKYQVAIQDGRIVAIFSKEDLDPVEAKELTAQLEETLRGNKVPVFGPQFEIVVLP